ncbi:MAG TPA: hypothetical protein VGE36_13570 [Roseateles sp.]
MNALTPGARAALDLKLQDARRDLKALIEEKNGYIHQADVCSALACEPGSGTVSNNQRAASLRLKAFSLGGLIHEAELLVANLQSQMKSVPAPVTLTAEQMAAVDDTAGLLA